jgi:cardiolipin synthase
LPAGPATGAEIAGLIAAATKSIDLEIYQLQDPAITGALIAAAARGVKVRVMLEPRTVGAANFKPMSARLKAAGISVQPTPPAFDSHHNVDHAKFLVLDGGSMLFGTGNLVRSGVGGIRAGEFNHRDFWVHDSRRASVAEATQLFQADWDRTGTSAIGFKSLVVTPENSDRAVLDLIGSAKKKVWVWNQSLSDPGVTAALLAAKARGADVRVLLGFQPGFGGAPAPNQPALDTLAAAGIPSGFYTRNYLHAKGVITEDRAFLGSQNFTNGGLKNNREVGEIVDDRTMLDELGRMFADDEKNPAP